MDLEPTSEVEERVRSLNEQSNRKNSIKKVIASFSVVLEEADQNWFLESCVTQHVTNQRSILYDYIKIGTDDEIVNIANRNANLKVEGYGSVRLKQKLNVKRKFIELKEVAYMSNIRTNLVSQPLAQKSGIRIYYPPNTLYMRKFKNEELVMIRSAQQHGNCELISVEAHCIQEGQ